MDSGLRQNDEEVFVFSIKSKTSHTSGLLSVFSTKSSKYVIPAEAGIHGQQKRAYASYRFAQPWIPYVVPQTEHPCATDLTYARMTSNCLCVIRFLKPLTISNLEDYRLVSIKL